MLTGSLVALITPMFDDGRVDYETLKHLIDWHIAEGTDAIVSVGTTGESATLTMEEHFKVIETTVQHVNGRVPVIAGTGANNTEEAVHLSRYAASVGADYAFHYHPVHCTHSGQRRRRHPELYRFGDGLLHHVRRVGHAPVRSAGNCPSPRSA